LLFVVSIDIIPSNVFKHVSPSLPSDSPSSSRFYYKLVATCGPQLYSIYDGVTEYKIGEVCRQQAKKNMKGGYYVYETAEEAVQAKLPDNSALYVAPRALIK
jgi:hypothetical protein